MPCSAVVTVDYRRESPAMPEPLTRSLLDSDISRIKYNTALSSSYTRRTSSSSSPIPELIQKYSSPRIGLGARSSSLTDDIRDRSQTRESTSRLFRDATRSRYSSESSSSKSSARRTNFTTYEIDEFKATYYPSNYIPNTLSRPPKSSESLRTRVPSTFAKEKRSEVAEVSNLEVISSENKAKEASAIVNGDIKLENIGDSDLPSTGEVNSTILKSEKLTDSTNPSESTDTCTNVGDSDVSIQPSNTFWDTGNISPRHIRSAVAATSRNKEIASFNSAGATSTTTNGLSGLRNIGNTCFLNSVVQCLSNTRVLKDFLINRDFTSEIRNSESRGALIKSFSDVIAELWSGEGRIVNTSSFKSQIQRYAPRFMGYNQQDAQEFLRYLLEGLHDDINRVAVKPRNLPEIDDNLSDSAKASESWKQYVRCDNSRIVDLFVGQLKSTLQCTSCGHSSTTFEVFWDLSLPLPSRTGSLRLQQCLDHFTKEEILDGDEMPTCSKCKTRRKCTKRFSIQKFPKILVLHLKRFSPSERYRKLSATVEFPLTNLDMSGYSTTPQVATYNLYAVSNHSGTAYSGHYTAYCLHSGTNQWYEFNDSRVSSISSRNVVSHEAYILFYEQNTGVTTSRL